MLTIIPVRIIFSLIICFSAISFNSCSPGSGGSSDSPGGQTVTAGVSWSANNEKAVNTTGGGYRVYYSKSSNFDISTASYVDVPYVSGSKAPTSASIELDDSGYWYFKVSAYSSLGGGSASEPSAEKRIDVSTSHFQ